MPRRFKEILEKQGKRPTTSPAPKQGGISRPTVERPRGAPTPGVRKSGTATAGQPSRKTEPKPGEKFRNLQASRSKKEFESQFGGGVRGGAEKGKQAGFKARDTGAPGGAKGGQVSEQEFRGLSRVEQRKLEKKGLSPRQAGGGGGGAPTARGGAEGGQVSEQAFRAMPREEQKKLEAKGLSPRQAGEGQRGAPQDLTMGGGPPGGGREIPQGSWSGGGGEIGGEEQGGGAPGRGEGGDAAMEMQAMAPQEQGSPMDQTKEPGQPVDSLPPKEEDMGRIEAKSAKSRVEASVPELGELPVEEQRQKISESMMKADISAVIEEATEPPQAPMRISMNRMPQSHEMKSLTKGSVVQTPYGDVSKDPTSGRVSVSYSPLMKEKVRQREKVELKEFGSYPNKTDPNGPQPELSVGRRSFNPYTGSFTNNKDSVLEKYMTKG